MEYAIDVARGVPRGGVQTVAVTAGYMCDAPRREFYAHIDAANVDLKAFTEDFYHRVTGGHLAPVLETLEYLKRETSVWFELTTLLIPGHNDSDAELDRMTRLGGRAPRPRRAAPLHARSIPTTGCSTCRRRRPRRSRARAGSRWRTACATPTPATCTTPTAAARTATAAARA